MNPDFFGTIRREGSLRAGCGTDFSRRRSLLGQSSGFSLLELMISLSLLAISLLGMLSLTTTSIQANLENDIRNAATRLTGQIAEILLVQPITSLATCGLHADATDPAFNAAYTYGAGNGCLTAGYQTFPNPNSIVRGTVQYPFNVTWTVVPLSDELRQVEISIRYTYKTKTIVQNAVVYKHKTT